MNVLTQNAPLSGVALREMILDEGAPLGADGFDDEEQAGSGDIEPAWALLPLRLV
jgi:hypothetical protein